MGRPRLGEGQRTAQERLEDAFWAMLEEMPYHEVTCKELRSRAGVSHTTFYYHFQDVEDLAQWAFERLAVPEVPAAIMSAVLGGVGTADGFNARIPGFETRFARMRLLASSGSPFLIGLLRDALVHAWLVSVGVSEEELASADRADITFAFGGVIALFGSDLASDPETLAAFSQREIGQSVMQTMQRLSERKRA